MGAIYILEPNPRRNFRVRLPLLMVIIGVAPPLSPFSNARVKKVSRVYLYHNAHGISHLWPNFRWLCVSFYIKFLRVSSVNSRKFYIPVAVPNDICERNSSLILTVSLELNALLFVSPKVKLDVLVIVEECYVWYTKMEHNLGVDFYTVLK